MKVYSLIHGILEGLGSLETTSGPPTLHLLGHPTNKSCGALQLVVLD